MQPEELEHKLRGFMHDSLAWRQQCIVIRAKNGRSIRYQDTPARKKVRRCLRTVAHHAFLKARQIGTSTEILLGGLHRCQFRGDSRVAITAHTADAAKSLLKLFLRLYDSQPYYMRASFPIVSRAAFSVEFANGSTVTANTAYSESWRSQTYDYVHLSEAAHYTDYESTIRSLLQCAAPDAIVLFETTPNGPNEFHEAWTDPTLRWNRVFLSWLDNTEYTSVIIPDAPITEVEREYIEENHLTDIQANWFRHCLATKCSGSIDTFRQEYPSDPHSCFLLSGRRFFSQVWQDTIVPKEQEVVALYHRPDPTRRYAIGIDGASGSPDGDYTAMTILDVTQTPYKVALRYAERIPPNEWAEKAAKVIHAFKCRAVLVESNHVGVAICETLIKNGIRVMTKDGRSIWTTTAQTRPVLLANLHQHVRKGTLVIDDPMIAGQCNTFVYNKNGKPEAASGKCDDLVFSTALACMAEKYVPHISPDVPLPKTGDTLADAMREEMRRFNRGGTLSLNGADQEVFVGI